MKHAIPAFALFSLAFAGCGKEAPPAPPAPAPAPAVSTAPKEVVHELDAAKHDIPAQPVSGKLAGNAFKPDRVELDGNILTFRQGPALAPDTQLMVIVQGVVPAEAEFKNVTKSDQKATDGIPSVAFFTKVGGEFKNESANEGYALTLELGKPTGGQVAGRIHLSLPGASKSVVAGTFTATYDRPPTAAPADADKPYVTGSITFTGKEGTTLVIGYARFPAEGQEAIYDKIEPTVPAANTAIGAVRSFAYKPRSVSVRPVGEGPAAAYDLTKLPPGKYLVAARVEGGIPAWYVREVKADSALTVPLELPTSGAGQVEVTVNGLPDGAVLQAQVLPAEVAADDPSGQYEANAGLILGTWADLIKGKATITQIPAGDYVVSARSADVRYSGKVTVKAGETAKVELKAAQ
jgi:hypothetical protein